MLQKFVVLILVAVLSFVVTSRGGAWWMIQSLRSVIGRSFMADKLDKMELEIWESWDSGWQYSKFTRETNLLQIQIVTELEEFQNLDLSKPFIAKNMSTSDFLSLEHLLSSPLGDIEVDYFSDARRDNTVPDAKQKLKDVAKRIVDGGPEKLGTQMIVKSNPHLVTDFVNQNTWLERVFGTPRISNWKDVGPTVTVPVFMSRGRAVSGDSHSSLSLTTRTDLHCEPISNVVVQTVGSKMWTLVEPRYSSLLKPTVAPDGRAYFYSRLNPLDPEALFHVPRYEVVTEKGDILYVPTWTWHRVQYLPDEVAVSMSIFEFLPSDFLFRNPLFAVTLVPNLIKEFVGLKTQ